MKGRTYGSLERGGGCVSHLGGKNSFLHDVK